MKRHFISVGLVALAIAGCTAPDSSVVEGHRGFNPLGLPFNNGLYGYLQTYVQRDMADGSDDYQSQAIFYNTSGVEVPASGASLNGSALTHGDNAYYTKASQTFDGAQHVWSISGNTSVPTFVDSVVSPYHFSISFPHYLTDSVSMGSGFTVTYANPHTDSVLIAIDYDAQFSHLLDTSIHYPNRHFIAWVPNTGSYTVSPGSLAGFPTKGTILVAVGGRNEKITTVMGKPMMIRAISATSTTSFIKP